MYAYYNFNVDILLSLAKLEAMLICFNASTEAKAALDNILTMSQFKDISEAISISLVTYNVLSQSVSKAGQVFPSGMLPQPIRPPGSTPDEGLPQRLQATQSVSAHGQAKEIPTAFRLAATTPDDIRLFEVPSAPSHSTRTPPHQWLFGQFNKFLAPKATCRALFNLLLESPAGIPVGEASNKISYAACNLGGYLQRLDDQLRSRREDAFSTAFPSGDTIDGGSESRLRFGNQFVAHIRKQQLGGFPAALRLVGTDAGKEPRLSLTQAGADFALLEPPILDAHGKTPTSKLSQAEVEFLIDHIINSVPEEASAYVAVLDAIKSGANTPDTVDGYLRQRFNLPTEKAITKTFLTTQRTGVISRMTDLRLLRREKNGLRVTYIVTPSGEVFLARAGVSH